MLLSTFGLVLHGIDNGYHYPKPKKPFSDPEPKCPAGSIGVFPMCEVHFTTLKYTEESTEENVSNKILPITTTTLVTQLPTTQVFTLTTQQFDPTISLLPKTLSSFPTTTSFKPTQTSQGLLEASTPSEPSSTPTSEKCEMGGLSIFFLEIKIDRFL